MKRTFVSLSVMAAVLFLIDRSTAQSDRPVAAKPKKPLPRPTDKTDFKMLHACATSIRPLHSKLGKPGPDDWLARHKETGQTFDEFWRDHRKLVRDQYDTICVQPLGEFAGTHQKLLTITADFLERFYGMPVTTLDSIALDNVPDSARRVHADTRDSQILTKYLLDDVLKPRLPKEAAALLGLTTSDLWPGEDWNFVFGQASLYDRVGVWSMYRFGDPDKNDEDYTLCLRRTLATASHETGHMLGIKHCVAYACGMNGSNHLRESDSRPLEFCPDCQQKIWWTCGLDPRDRFQRLLEFADEHALADEAEYWRKAIEAIDKWRPKARKEAQP